MRETIDQNPSRVERFKEGVLEDKGFKMPSRKRPMNTNECKSISDIERWRHELTKDISRKIEKSHEPGLTDAQMRDLNDLINKLLAEKAKWEYRVIELGGPDYIVISN